MKTSIIFYSYSGNTRGVAEKVRDACGGDLVEVKPKSDYSSLTAYTIGCYRAVKGMGDPIEPETIDVAADDVIVIGTPVWAGRATPAINAAVAALDGCRGKRRWSLRPAGKTGETPFPSSGRPLRNGA
jgi:multimeric flavodoxin WrbA